MSWLGVVIFQLQFHNVLLHNNEEDKCRGGHFFSVIIFLILRKFEHLKKKKKQKFNTRCKKCVRTHQYTVSWNEVISTHIPEHCQ